MIALAWNTVLWQAEYVLRVLRSPVRGRAYHEEEVKLKIRY